MYFLCNFSVWIIINLLLKYYLYIATTYVIQRVLTYMGHIFDFWSCSLIWRYFVIWRSILGHDMFNRPTENSTKKIVKPCWWHFDDIKSLIWDETELKGTIFKWRAADFPYFVFGAQSTRVQWRRLRARFGPVHYGAWGARYTPAPERVLERGTVANEISTFMIWSIDK